MRYIHHPVDRQETWIHYTYDADMKAHSWWIKCTASQILCLLLQWHRLYCLQRRREMQKSAVVRSEAMLHTEANTGALQSGIIKLHNMRYLHYCGSNSMSWRSLLWIQRAEECVTIDKRGEIIDHLNLYSFKWSHHEYVDDLDLWRLWIFCVWSKKTHQSHTWQLSSYPIMKCYNKKLDILQ